MNEFRAAGRSFIRWAFVDKDGDNGGVRGGDG